MCCLSSWPSKYILIIYLFTLITPIKENANTAITNADVNNIHTGSAIMLLLMLMLVILIYQYAILNAHTCGLSFLLFYCNIKCILQQCCMVTWVKNTVKFYIYFRDYVRIYWTVPRSVFLTHVPWTFLHCTVNHFPCCNTPHAAQHKTWISGHSLNTSLCCYQAGLHLPATEGQPYGDPQQGGRAREASPQH